MVSTFVSQAPVVGVAQREKGVCTQAATDSNLPVLIPKKGVPGEGVGVRQGRDGRGLLGAKRKRRRRRMGRKGAADASWLKLQPLPIHPRSSLTSCLSQLGETSFVAGEAGREKGEQ